MNASFCKLDPISNKPKSSRSYASVSVDTKSFPFPLFNLVVVTISVLVLEEQHAVSNHLRPPGVPQTQILAFHYVMASMFYPRALVNAVSSAFTMKTNLSCRGGRSFGKTEILYEFVDDMEDGDFPYQTIDYDQKSYRSRLSETKVVDDDPTDTDVLSLGNSVFDNDEEIRSNKDTERKAAISSYEYTKDEFFDEGANRDWHDVFNEDFFELYSSRSEASLDEEPSEDTVDLTMSELDDFQSDSHRDPRVNPNSAAPGEANPNDHSLGMENTIFLTDEEINHAANTPESSNIAEPDQVCHESVSNEWVELNEENAELDEATYHIDASLRGDFDTDEDDTTVNNDDNWVREWNCTHQHQLRECLGKDHTDYVNFEDVEAISSRVVTNGMMFTIESIPDTDRDGGEVLFFMKVGHRI